MSEGEWDRIVNLWGKEIDNYIKNGIEVSDAAYEDLFYYFQSQMPMGTQKARTGDPYNFICDHIEEEFGEDK